MKNDRFECCFELEHKGIYFEVEDNINNISFTMYNRHEPETQVCLRNDDIDRLVELLQKMRSNKS